MATVSNQSVQEGVRRSSSIRRVPAAQWLRVIVQTVRDLWSVNVLEWASSLAFYGFISAFPLLIGILIVESYVLDSPWLAQQVTGLLANFLPEGGAQAGDILESAVSERRRVGILSLVIFFFTGRRVLGVLTKGLNHVSDGDARKDSLVRRISIELALLVGLVAFVLLSLVTRPLLNLAWDTARFIPGPDNPAVTVMTGVFRVVPIVATFVLVYAFVPQGTRLWRAVLVGAGAATVLFLMAQAVFNLLAARIWDTLALLYGPLALAALLLSWIWYVAVITLVGGGFASHVKVMVLEQRSAEHAHQEHVK